MVGAVIRPLSNTHYIPATSKCQKYNVKCEWKTIKTGNPNRSILASNASSFETSQMTRQIIIKNHKI